MTKFAVGSPEERNTLLNFVNAILAKESYIANGKTFANGGDVEYNSLVDRIMDATEKLHSVSGLVFDPYHDKEMWDAIWSRPTP